MFCHLVGSISISAGLDAEDWRDLVGSPLDAAPSEIRARTLHEMAHALNARGIQTARGGQWYATTVRNVLVRG